MAHVSTATLSASFGDLGALSVQAMQTLRRPRACARTSVHECRDIQQEADMTPRIPENVSSWSFATIMGNTMPP
jgi:hypothetical protein